VTERQAVPSTGRVAMSTEAPLGPIFSFVPAGGVPAGGVPDAGGPRTLDQPVPDQRVLEMTRKLAEALRVFLASQGDERAVLLADFQKDSAPRLDPQPFTITVADLSSANPEQAWLAASLSEAIFVVASTGAASLAEARDKAAWLRAVKPDECCGLVLFPVPGGATAHQAEEITGLPVCAVIHKESQIAQLACWIAQE
jgi:hypothetical protein